VTDADLVLGYLNEQYFLGGTMTLNREKAEAAIYNKIAKPLGISIAAAAWGIHRVVNENMANAARVHIIEKGFDPRFFSMLAFGGAGPVHAFHVARLLKSPQLLIPAGAGVLSALGFLVSPVATQEISSYLGRLDTMNWDMLNTLLEGMRARTTAFLVQAGISEAAIQEELVADMRYLGQGHEITVPIPPGCLGPEHLELISENFRKEYQLRYGRAISGIPIESVTWRLIARGPEPAGALHQTILGDSGPALKGTREVFWGETYESTPVYDRYAMEIGREYAGPCIIEEFESTTVVGKNSSVHIDPLRHIVITLKEPGA
jgi:N-methylhydantoinase A